MLRRYFAPLLVLLAIAGIAIAADDDISRLYNFVPGTTIQSSKVNQEFNQLISTMNGKMSRAGVNTISGANTFSGTQSFTHATTPIKTDKIAEYNSAAGVTIDGVLNKDGMVTVSGTPAAAGQIGYASNVLTFYNGSSVITLAGITDIGLSKGHIGGPPPVYATASTITLPTGIRVRSYDNTADIEAAGDLTVSLASSGANGLDTGSEATSTWYFVYLIKKSSDGTVAGLLSVTNEAASGSVTLPSGYDLKRQLPLAIYNNSSGDIRPFRIVSGWPYMPKVRWLGTSTQDTGSAVTPGTLNVLNGGTSATYASVNCAAFVPPISKTADLFFASRGAVGDKTIRTDSSTGNVINVEVENSGGGYHTNWPDFPLTSSQTFEYQSSGGQAMSFDVLGFTVTEVN